MKKKFIISLIAFLIAFPVFCLGFLVYGPFENVRKTWICTAMSTASHKYLATSLFSQSTVESYLLRYFNTVDDIPKQQTDGINTNIKGCKITVTDVSTGFANGKLMTVSNPDCIDVAQCNYIGTSGLTLKELIRQENAVAGINAGAYVENSGTSHGSMPGGVIVKNGKITYMQKTNEKTPEFCIVGFDNNNILRTGYVKNEAEVNSYNLRCAVSFGPPLIVNGEAMIKTSGNSLQPRTAIAQKSDGSVMLLVLDGRQSSSAGATIKNVQDLLLKNGAVTAVNLDGGSSTSMEYNDELLNSPSDDKIEKQIPTAFVVIK